MALADHVVDVAVEPATYARVAETHERAGEISARVPTYGRTTGVGANRAVAVAEDDALYGVRLLRSHALDTGAPVPRRAVRAMLAVRLAQLCEPGSGLDPAVLDGLVAMLNADALPEILSRSAVGTADLAALAGTALTLMGEREADGPLEPMPTWGNASALPFISSSALTIGRACLALDELERLLDATLAVFALSFTGLRGNPSAFCDAAATASATPGTAEVATLLQRLVPDPGTPARIQDPFGLRAFVVSHACAGQTVRRLREQLTALVNAAQENPLFVLDGGSGGDVVHHGGFFQAALALAADAVTLAVAQSAPLTLSRIRMVNEPDFTGLAPFLTVGPPGSSGLLMVEYVAAAALADLRQAATPASVGTISISRGSEDHASFATQAIDHLESCATALRTLLSCELVGTVRLLRQLPDLASFDDSDPRAGLSSLTGLLPSDDEDHDLRPDLAVAANLLDALALPVAYLTP